MTKAPESILARLRPPAGPLASAGQPFLRRGVGRKVFGARGAARSVSLRAPWSLLYRIYISLDGFAPLPLVDPAKDKAVNSGEPEKYPFVEPSARREALKPVRFTSKVSLSNVPYSLVLPGTLKAFPARCIAGLFVGAGRGRYVAPAPRRAVAEAVRPHELLESQSYSIAL